MKPILKNLQSLGRDFLRSKGVEEAQAKEAVDFLLLEILSFQKKSDLFLAASSVLSRSQRTLYFSWLKRCAQGEPLPYFSGKVEFLGRVFQVSPACLIPRPETQELLAAAADWVRDSLRHRAQGELRFLDMGTGSGVIAVTLLHFFPQASVLAVDISDEALQVAIKNAEINGVNSKITWQKSFLLQQVSSEETFDAILANLPYLSETELAQAPPELSFEPRTALLGGEEGWELIATMILAARDFLRPGGRLFLEIGASQGPRVLGFLQQAGYRCAQVLQDKNGLDRVAIGEWKNVEKPI